MVITVTGRLELAKEVAIAHQVNDQGVMGSGVAKALYTKYPKVKEEYLKLYSNKFHESYLGSIQPVETEGKVIYNIFSQVGYGHSGKQYTHYGYLNVCLHKLNYDLKSRGLNEIAFPYKFGCGLGGGDWDIVKPMILESLDVDVIFYKLEEDG